MDGAPVLDRLDNDHSFAAGSPESTAKQSAVHTIRLTASSPVQASPKLLSV
jgi:hypothetical protein